MKHVINEYKENYAHGGYCHEQSFRFGFQEGVEFTEYKLADAEYNRGFLKMLLRKQNKLLLTLCHYLLLEIII